MPESLEVMSLKLGQTAQILDQYRIEMYNQQLKVDLLQKMLEEKGILVAEEFAKRWPLYLKNDIGVIGQNGLMEGSLKVSKYGTE